MSAIMKSPVVVRDGESDYEPEPEEEEEQDDEDELVEADQEEEQEEEEEEEEAEDLEEEEEEDDNLEEDIEEQDELVGEDESRAGTDSEDEEKDENVLQKLSPSTADSIVTEYHPESRILGYDEVSALALIQRDADGLTIDDLLHRTLPFLTKYEKARVLGLRTAQLNDGAPTMLPTKPDETIIDNSIIAEMELQQKVIPFIIQRPLPNGVSEYWHLHDLELIT